MKPAFILCALTLPAGAALGDTCPAAPDHTVKADQLIQQLQLAPDESASYPISAQLWQLWLDAPDAQAQALLDRGMAKRRVADYAGAIAEFDQLVAYCPDYAEGYNQRAFANFLRADFEEALADLELALARSPRHVAALSGKALTLIGLKRDAEAQTFLKEALSLNPWLSERRFLLDTSGPKQEL